MRQTFMRLSLLIFILFTNLLVAKLHAAVIGDYDLTMSDRFLWVIAYSATNFVIAYSLGLPDIRSRSQIFKAALVTPIATAILFSVLQISIGRSVLPRFVIGISIPSIFILLYFISTFNSRLKKLSAEKERILLICTVDDAQLIEADLAFHSEVPCVVACHFTLEDIAQIGDVDSFVSQNKISLVVLGKNTRNDLHAIRIVKDFHAHGVRVRSQLAFYNDWIGKTPVRELGEAALLFDVREIHRIGYSRISRMIDIGVASAGFVALLVATPFVWLCNKFGNKGPLLYSQERIGKGQVPFQIYKFRTMVEGSSIGEWTKVHDERITKFGKFLRVSHLDELPQVLNILRGDLSIVGPRPEQSHYVEQLAKVIPFYEERHLVRPGLTGWAQVNYPYGADEIDAFEKLQYEFWYLQHQSMWLDLRIIARTFRHVLGFKGR
jgi:lipopolysaccharide/colanic/teichoic acid biosynthesis glycosyltransferase